MTQMDPVAAALAAAQKAATDLVAAQAAVVSAAPASQAVTVANTNQPPAVGRPLTMDDMTGGLTVDQWLGVKEHGFLLGPQKVLYDGEIHVEIDMARVQPNFSVKFGNPTTYFRTYDRMTEVRGGLWSDALRRAQAVDPRATEYRSVDLPMVVLQDIKKGKEVLIEAGQTVGYSTPTTGWGAWQAFYAECVRAGLQNSRVEAVLNYQKRTNAKGNVWGIITYALKVPATASQSAA